MKNERRHRKVYLLQPDIFGLYFIHNCMLFKLSCRILYFGNWFGMECKVIHINNNTRKGEREHQNKL